MTPRDRRALHLGVGVVLGALLVTRLLPAGWRAWAHQQEELQAERSLLARAEGALSGLDSVDRRGAALRASLVALAPRLLSGATEAEATADLTGRIALIALHQRTKVLRTEAVPDTVHEGRLYRLTVRVEVESDWSGLAGFLRAVVSDPTTLPVRAINVRGSEVPTATSGPEVLAGELEVSGWYLSGVDRIDSRARGE